MLFRIKLWGGRHEYPEISFPGIRFPVEKEYCISLGKVVLSVGKDYFTTSIKYINELFGYFIFDESFFWISTVDLCYRPTNILIVHKIFPDNCRV